MRGVVPPTAGLCSTCGQARLVASKRSTYVRCELSDRDPAFARYPLLPVLVCRGYVLRREASEHARSPE